MIDRLRRMMRYALIVTLLLSASCTGTLPFYDSAQHATGFISVAPNVRLQYLDFGGSGEYMVFLAGAGDSAYVFTDFAPRFTNMFHVIAITRRGFGESSQPSSGYDTATLAEDVHNALETLEITRADFVGHSFAGDELTRLAINHPEQVDKLVYLDAAYDLVDMRGDLNATMIPAAPPPKVSDLASPAAVAAYVARTNGLTAFPEVEIRATNVFDSDGKYLRPVTPPEISQALVNGEEHPDYVKLQAPALAIYTVPDVVTDWLPWLSTSSANWGNASTLFPSVQASLQRQRDKFRNAVANGTIIEMHGTPHFLFIYDTDKVENYIRSFLSAP